MLLEVYVYLVIDMLVIGAYYFFSKALMLQWLSLKLGICMNKSELVEKIASDADITKASAERALSSAIEQIIKSVTKGDDVQLIGFGTLSQASVRLVLGAIHKLVLSLRYQLPRQ